MADRSTDAVRLAIDEARREQGRHIAIRVMEQPSGRILSSVYAREAQI